MSRRLVLFGAGNIGRSFIGQVFARNGYEVVFVDINERVIGALNERRGYDVVIKHPDGAEETLPVRGVRGVLASDREAVCAELATADLAATAVGAGALPSVAGLIRDGLAWRHTANPDAPLDIILAENVRDAAAVVAAVLGEGGANATDTGMGDGAATGAGPLVGLVQTSIGKMVPIVPAEAAERDPLLVFAEPYNTLIVDARGFRGPVPRFPEVKAVDHIDAWVDRKLFLHNLGHAAVAYLGYRITPQTTSVAEAVDHPEVRAGARSAMTEAAAALAVAYPESFTEAELIAHRDDLLARFANRALGDTVFRVGRDLRRKLSRDDRIVGAMLLAAGHDRRFASVARVYVAALGFGAADETGRPFPGDVEITNRAEHEGIEAILREISGLDPSVEPDRTVVLTTRAALG